MLRHMGGIWTEERIEVVSKPLMLLARTDLAIALCGYDGLKATASINDYQHAARHRSNSRAGSTGMGPTVTPQ